MCARVSCLRGSSYRTSGMLRSRTFFIVAPPVLGTWTNTNRFPSEMRTVCPLPLDGCPVGLPVRVLGELCGQRLQSPRRVRPVVELAILLNDLAAVMAPLQQPVVGWIGLQG